MKIVERIESRERCAEAGWYAYDYLLDEQITREFPLFLKRFGGSFLFLDMLKKPFFKIEAEHYIIKGLLGDDFFRMAVHQDASEELERLESFLKEKIDGK